MQWETYNPETDQINIEGRFSDDDFEIGSESFRHLRKIAQEIRFLRRLSLALTGLVVILGVFLALSILVGKEDPTVAGAITDKFLSEVADTVKMLKAENIRLREKNASLQNDLKLLKRQFVAKNAAEEPREPEFVPTEDDNIVYHEVINEETIYSIAEKYYGDRSKYEKIMKDNGLFLPSEVTVGKQLKIYRHQ